LEHLKAAIFALISRVQSKADELGLSAGITKEQVDNIYVR
jgi:hypothetical protein